MTNISLVYHYRVITSTFINIFNNNTRKRDSKKKNEKTLEILSVAVKDQQTNLASA